MILLLIRLIMGLFLSLGEEYVVPLIDGSIKARLHTFDNYLNSDSLIDTGV